MCEFCPMYGGPCCVCGGVLEFSKEVVHILEEKMDRIAIESEIRFKEAQVSELTLEIGQLNEELENA